MPRKCLTLLLGSPYPPTSSTTSLKEEEATVTTLSSSTTTTKQLAGLKEERQAIFGKIECFSSSPLTSQPNCPWKKKKHILRVHRFFFYQRIKHTLWKNNNTVFRENDLFLFFWREVVVRSDFAPTTTSNSLWQKKVGWRRVDLLLLEFFWKDFSERRKNRKSPGNNDFFFFYAFAYAPRSLPLFERRRTRDFWKISLFLFFQKLGFLILRCQQPIAHKACPLLVCLFRPNELHFHFGY